MAVLAQNDWQPPRDTNPIMDSRNQQNIQNIPNNVQNIPTSAESSVPHTPSPTQQQAHLQPQLPQQQPYQQQQWQPSPQAPPFYPAYPSYFPAPHPPPNPYFDPNQHFAQWAYQQMMFNAQAQAQAQAQFHQQMLTPEFPRARGGTPPQQQPDFFQQQQQQRVAPEPFHPYPNPGQSRRPSRQASGSGSTDAHANSHNHVPQPPYARADAAGSSSSINSGSSGRSRKGSNPTPTTSATASSHGRTASRASDRTPSVKSPVSSTSTSPVQIEARTEVRRPSKPSPLGQVAVAAPGSRPGSSGTVRPSSPTTPTNKTHPQTHNKRLSISKDDSELGVSEPTTPANVARSGGLKGRLRRALSFNASSTLDGADNDDKLNSRRKALLNASKVNALVTSSSVPPSPDSPTAPAEPKSRPRRSLFNSKINASTDNISLSSTVSSASVMIRKLGSMGRLARKNSLMGITSLFKDKQKHGSTSGSASEASVSLATAEIDRGEGGSSIEIAGLSPAARLARQHTIRSNEQAARRKAEEEATAAKELEREASVPVWERGTTNRKGARIGHAVFNEDDDDDDSGSNSDGSDNGTYDGEEDVTIRVQVGQMNIGESLGGTAVNSTDEDSWAVGIRRSAERVKRPSKGILKYAGTYSQEAIFAQGQSSLPTTRVRSNSYNHTNHAEPGPLARIPSPDPDHIDGLHHTTHSNSSHNHKEFIPPFAFDDTPLPRSSSPQPQQSLFNLASLNSSAPALSSVGAHSYHTRGPQKSSIPAKRLAFAANLSIYDTFSAAVYDRRSEPATCNRLTPALAQRIKEELNSYKMEEMEVHADSRMHTQFFV